MITYPALLLTQLDISIQLTRHCHVAKPDSEPHDDAHHLADCFDLAMMAPAGYAHICPPRLNVWYHVGCPVCLRMASIIDQALKQARSLALEVQFNRCITPTGAAYQGFSWSRYVLHVFCKVSCFIRPECSLCSLPPCFGYMQICSLCILPTILASP